MGAMAECGTCGDPDHSTWQHRIDSPAPSDQAGLLPQHKRCWSCGQVTYLWDHMPCGQHGVPGQETPVSEAPPVTPPRARHHDLQALALAQAADSRAQRLACLDPGACPPAAQSQG